MVSIEGITQRLNKRSPEGKFIFVDLLSLVFSFELFLLNFQSFSSLFEGHSCFRRHNELKKRISDRLRWPVQPVLSIKPDPHQRVNNSNCISKRLHNIPAQPIHKKYCITESHQMCGCYENGCSLVPGLSPQVNSVQILDSLFSILDQLSQ